MRPVQMDVYEEGPADMAGHAVGFNLILTTSGTIYVNRAVDKTNNEVLNYVDDVQIRVRQTQVMPTLQHIVVINSDVYNIITIDKTSFCPLISYGLVLSKLNSEDVI